MKGDIYHSNQCQLNYGFELLEQITKQYESRNILVKNIIYLEDPIKDGYCQYIFSNGDVWTFRKRLKNQEAGLFCLNIS